jgi:GAF domain-containing protein
MDPRSLFRLADCVSDADGPAAIYEPAIDAIMATTGAQRAGILLLDDEGVMRFRAARGLSERYRATVEGHSPWTADVQDPASVAIPDALADPSLSALRDVLVAEGVRALAFVPLTYRHRLIGKFMLYYDRVHDFSEDELNTATLVAQYVAFGLDRAHADVASKQLFERERAGRREAEAANQAKDEFLATVAHELRNPLGAVVNAVSILDRRADARDASSRDPPPDRASRPPPRRPARRRPIQPGPRSASRGSERASKRRLRNRRHQNEVRAVWLCTNTRQEARR